MKNKSLLIAAALSIVLLPLHSVAWDCKIAGEIRVQVPTGTIGNGVGDGDGQVVVDNGLTFQCQKPPSTVGTSTSASTSNSSSNSSSGAKSGSKSSATGGNATATGGISSSSSGVTGSGNSSNTNTNNATGGAGGSASQKQSNSSTNNNASTATGNGDNSNNSTTTVEAPKIPVPTAYAPTTLPTVPCFKGYGVGAQVAQAGISLGGGKIDANCAILETARSYDMVNEKLAACKVKISNKYSKKAGVTLEDCMTVQMMPVPLAPHIVAAPAQPIQVTVNVPAPETKLIYITMPHEEITVTAPPLGNVKPATKKPVHRGKPCIVPTSLTQPLGQ